MVVIPILILGTGGIEIFRIFRAQRAVEVAVSQAIEEYRRPTKNSANTSLREKDSKAAWTRSLDAFSPNIPDGCNRDGACAEVVFSEQTVDGRRFVNVNGLLKIRSLFYRSFFYEIRKSGESILEDGQASMIGTVQFGNDL